MFLVLIFKDCIEVEEKKVVVLCFRPLQKVELGGVYMTPGLFICSHDTTTKCRCESQRDFTPLVVPEQDFHSGTKFRNGIMQTRNAASFGVKSV